ncbi:MAG: hypothetical protein ACLPV4_24895 [Solirubrobacteraceae bacterium]
MRRHQTPARRRLLLIASTTVIAIAGLGATAAPSMADIRLATTTTVAASPSVIGTSGSTTLTASIRPGFLIGPLGNVAFTDSNNGAALGTVKPGLQCILRAQPCIATVTVQASVLAAGNNTIVAAYSGGILTKPSSGSTDVFVGTTCQPNSGMCSLSATSSDGTTSTTISTTAPSSGPPETVQASFTTETPPCTTSGEGDTLVYAVTNPGGETKTVTLTLTGSAADSEYKQFGSYGNVCFFDSPTSFTTDNGTENGGTSVLGSDGLYYGNLPLCDDGDGDNDFTNGESGGRTVVPVGTYPCINYVNSSEDTWATYTNGSANTPSTSTYTESFTTTASDPKAHG